MNDKPGPVGPISGSRKTWITYGFLALFLGLVHAVFLFFSCRRSLMGLWLIPIATRD